MCDRPTDRSPRGEEEQVDMRVRLRNDREVAVELRMQAAQRDVFSQTAILEAGATEVVRLDLTVPVFRDQDDRVQYPWHGCTGDDSGPDDAVG